MSALARWLKYAAPAPLPAALSSAAGGLLVLGLFVGAGYGLSQGQGLVEFLENAGFTFGLLVAPFAALLMGAAAIVERQPFPRAWLFAGAGGAWLLGGAGAAVGLAATAEAGPGPAFVAFCMLCAPTSLLALGPAVYFGAKAAPGVRAEMLSDRDRRVLELVTLRGETTLSELARSVEAGERDVLLVLDRLRQARAFTGLADARSGHVYSPGALLEKQRRLAETVTAHGQITLGELAAELHAPRELLREWVYALVRRGGFTGYVNWDEGVIYSAEARKLAAAGSCPRCGGKLNLAGRGVVQCGHCGAEVFT
jgi:DNA-binding Lrp family transcriptional regulator